MQYLYRAISQENSSYNLLFDIVIQYDWKKRDWERERERERERKVEEKEEMKKINGRE